MKTEFCLLLCALSVISPAVVAQQPSPQSGAVYSSTPGKASAATVTEITATVVGVDKGTRVVTLKGPKGRTVDVVAGDEVRNFDQIKVGDNVVVRYQEALTLELKKVRGTPVATEATGTARAAPGERPAGAMAREVVVLADVVAVDPANSKISLKGPRGNVVDIKVQNPEHFKVVKKGDQVQATYTEALAVAVTPAPKATGK